MSSSEETLQDRVEQALADIRPFLQKDGGDITLEELTDEKVARVKLHGACSSCSMSPMTMKTGVEEAIKKAAPEIQEVEAINMPDPEDATPFGR